MNEVRSRGRRRSREEDRSKDKIEVHRSDGVEGEDSRGAGVGQTTPQAEEQVQRVRTTVTARKVEIPRHVLAKLIFFSLLMLVVPLGVFYASFKFFFHGNIVYSTIFAIVAVNTILFGYVLVAILEKDDSNEAGICKKDT